MMPEKDPERENTYFVTNDVLGEDNQNESDFFTKFINIFSF